MTPCCTNCLHWDEEQVDKFGRAPCLPLFNAFDQPHNLCCYITDGDVVSEIRTRGDFGCVLFCPKRVGKPTDEQTST